MGTRAGRRQDADSISRTYGTRSRNGVGVQDDTSNETSSGACSRRPGTDFIGALRCSRARFALRRRPSALGSSRAAARGLRSGVRGHHGSPRRAAGIRNKQRQGSDRSLDIAIRGAWPGVWLCPVAKGGSIQTRDMTAQAVMVRVRSIAEQGGVDPVAPNDLRLTYLTDLARQKRESWSVAGTPDCFPTNALWKLRLIRREKTPVSPGDCLWYTTECRC